MKDTGKLSVLEKCAYGAGDMGSNFIWFLIAIHSTFFYTEYFGLAIGTVTAMMAIITMIDLLFDVYVGAVADRHKTKLGRFRPWILYGVVPFVAITIITFYTPDLDESMKLIYAFLSFLLLRLMYSVVNVPYGALMGVISGDARERDSVSAYRNIFAQIGWFCASTLFMPAVKYLQDTFELQGKVAFFYIVSAYAVVAGLLLFFTFWGTKERVEPVAEENSPIKDDLKDLITNKPWIIVTLAGILMLVFTTCHNFLINYYCKYYLSNMYADPSAPDGFRYELIGTFFGNEMSWELFSSIMFGFGSVITIVATILCEKFLIGKLGKSKSWVLCFVLASVASAFYLFVPKESLAVIILLQILFTLFIGPCSFIMWSMYADIADNTEVQTGRRATGLIFSSATMSQKLGNTLAAIIPGAVLSFVGFKANDLNMSDSVREMILYVFALFPIISAVFAVICLKFYNIDEKKIEENSKELARRKAEKEAL